MSPVRRNSVHLGDGSSNLPRDNSDSIGIPFIYAPIRTSLPARAE